MHPSHTFILASSFCILLFFVLFKLFSSSQLQKMAPKRICIDSSSSALAYVFFLLLITRARDQLHQKLWWLSTHPNIYVDESYFGKFYLFNSFNQEKLRNLIYNKLGEMFLKLVNMPYVNLCYKYMVITYFDKFVSIYDLPISGSLYTSKASSAVENFDFLSYSQLPLTWPINKSHIHSYYVSYPNFITRSMNQCMHHDTCITHVS